MKKYLIMLIICILIPYIVNAEEKAAFVDKSSAMRATLSREPMLKDLPEIKKEIIERQYSQKIKNLFDQIKKNPALLAEGLEVAEKWKIDLNKKFHDALVKNQSREIERLIESPYVDIMWQDDIGATALHKAAGSSRKKYVKMLVEKGADIKQRDNVGSTPLHYAAKGKKRDNLDYLLDKGAEINYQNNEGDTPLHIACALGDINITKFLLNRGADKTIKNNGGKMPYDLAVAVGKGKAFESLFKE